MNSPNSIEEQLRATKPETPLPDSLHSSIMHAVRASSGTQPSTRSSLPLRWGAASVAVLAALLVVVGIEMAMSPQNDLRHRESAATLATVAPALEGGRALAEAMPAVVFNPLTDELACVNRDVRNALAHLVASVP